MNKWISVSVGRPLTAAGARNRFETMRLLFSIAAGLPLCVILIVLVSDEPFRAMRYLFAGPLTTYNRMAEVIEKMQPMLLTGCSFQLMLVIGNFSLINDSCVVLAPCLICAPIILNEELFGGIPGELGKIVWITVSCIASGVIGAAVSMLPPLIKRQFGCNEVITSSLMNSIFGFFAEWFVKHILYDEEAGLSASKPYPAQVKPTKLIYGSRVTTMILVGLLFCVITYFFLYHTKLGYAAQIVGANPSFAMASGIPVKKVSLLVSAFAGAVAGFSGTLNTLSYNTRFSGFAANISDGMFCGIFAKSNPLLLPVAAFGLGYLRVTAETMGNNTDVPIELITVMTSFIIMMLAADQLFHKQIDSYIVRHFAHTPEERERRV